MKTIFTALTLVITLAQPAKASVTDVRLAVEAISDSIVQGDLAAALKDADLGFEVRTSKAGGYVVCPVKLDNECYRFEIFSLSKKSEGYYDANPQHLVLSYHGFQQGETVKLDEVSSEISDRNLDLNLNNVETLKRVLPLLEKDYAGDLPIKGRMAIHPFSVKIVQIAGLGDREDMNGDNDHWNTSSNTLISFSEYVVSTVTYFQTSHNYLVRTVDDGDKILKHDVRRLKLDQLLK